MPASDWPSSQHESQRQSLLVEVSRCGFWDRSIPTEVFTTVPTQLSQLFIGTAQLLSVGARKPDSSRHLGSVKLNGNTSPKLCKAPVGSCVKSV